MKYAAVASRMQMIFTAEEMNRMDISADQNTVTEITVDVHGLKCTEARNLINNLINLIRGAFRLVVIHGYNHGMAIKTMLHNEFQNPKVYRKIGDHHNMGVTYLYVGA